MTLDATYAIPTLPEQHLPTQPAPRQHGCLRLQRLLPYETSHLQLVAGRTPQVTTRQSIQKAALQPETQILSAIHLQVSVLHVSIDVIS